MSDARPEDALTLVRSQVPDRIYRFAEAMAADPDLSPEKAAIKIGAPGQAASFLKDARTAKVLAVILQDAQETFKDLRRQTIQFLAALATHDPVNAFDEYNRVRRMDEIPPMARMAIQEYEVRPDGSCKVKWINRTKILELLLQHFGDIDSRAYAPTGQAQIIFRGREARG